MRVKKDYAKTGRKTRAKVMPKVQVEEPSVSMETLREVKNQENRKYTISLFLWLIIWLLTIGFIIRRCNG